MKTRRNAELELARIALITLAALPLAACAQTPVDDNGQVIGTYESADAIAVEAPVMGNEDIPLLSDVDLVELVGPIALYPDDLLAIVLPAAAYPLQIMEAARFLEDMESDPSLKPDPDWDDSVVALLNYPEVIELLNEDIDWTWRLGEAVVSQQGDVVGAIETFRDRAYAAGNLKSDSYQTVTRDEGIIEITPVSDDVIYVPYYEPERVVVYQPRPVYYYYPRSYPVYYYPYSSAYDFHRGYFWGVTTAFTIGWLSDSLHVYHHSYHGHPYYGHSYRDRWWYRRPSINVYNTTYSRNTSVTINRYYNGDNWRPRHDRRDYVYDERITRNRHYQPRQPEQVTRRSTERSTYQRRQTQQPRVTQQQRTTQQPRVTQPQRQTQQARQTQQRSTDTRTAQRQEPITFRDRSTERREPVSLAQRQRSATEARSSQRTSKSPTQSVQERREPPVRQTNLERRQTTSQRPSEPQRVASAQRRETPAQQRVTTAQQRTTRQSAPQRTTVQQRPERREPVRQASSPQRATRAAPQRATPQRSAPQRAAPQRSAPQQHSETRSAPKSAEKSRSGSRSDSGRRSSPRKKD